MTLNDFYSELLIEYANDSSYQNTVPNFNFEQELLNPLCGDLIKVIGRIEADQITELKFSGQGCAISKASAAILCSLNKNCSLLKSKNLIEIFEKMILGEVLSINERKLLGDAIILEGVSKIPGRQRCALLAWENLKKVVNSKLENDPS